MNAAGHSETRHLAFDYHLLQFHGVLPHTLLAGQLLCMIVFAAVHVMQNGRLQEGPQALKPWGPTLGYEATDENQVREFLHDVRFDVLHDTTIGAIEGGREYHSVPQCLQDIHGHGDRYWEEGIQRAVGQLGISVQDNNSSAGEASGGVSPERPPSARC